MRSRLAATTVLTLVGAFAFSAIGALPAYAASVAGTVEVSLSSDGQNFGETFTDAESTNDIAGTTYEMYYAEFPATPSGDVIAWNYGNSPMLFNTSTTGFLAPAYNFVIRNSGSDFKLSSLQYQHTAGDSATMTVTPFRDGVEISGGAQSFSVDCCGFLYTFTLGSGFDHVDEVRVTTVNPGEGNVLNGAFDTFVFADPIRADDSALAGLGISASALSPAFAPGTTAYSAEVMPWITSTTVTPTLSNGAASVTVNGVPTTSGSASGAIALNTGSNTITVQVTSADTSSTTSYVITVTRLSNTALTALALSNGTLSPAFAWATTSYTASVPFATTSTTVTPTAALATASITVNGVLVASGGTSGAIALAVGANTITVVVSDWTLSTSTYTVTVTRAASSNADLSALSLSSGTLAPAFASGTTGYTASVGNATTSLTVTPTVASGTSSITVNGVATTSGNASGAIALNVGSNTITTVVTAQDGTTTKTYTATVTRAASGNADLSALSLSSGTLAPAFSSGTTGYTASVGNATTSLTATPTVASGTSSITVNGVATTSGNASGAIALNVGSNTITTVVTAQDGTTTKTYAVTVTRAATLPTWTDDTLAAFGLSDVYSDSVTAVGTATIVYSVSLGALPAGVTLDASTGLVSGTPTSGAAYSFELTATNGAGSISQTFAGTPIPVAALDIALNFSSGDPVAGSTVTLEGEGLAGLTQIDLVLHSTPVTLYSSTLLLGGTFSQVVAIPSNTPAGAHSLVLTSSGSSDGTFSVTVWFSVLANGTIGAVSLTGPVAYVAALAATGVDAEVPAGAVTLLLAVGAGLLMVAGYRRRSASSS